MREGESYATGDEIRLTSTVKEMPVLTQPHFELGRYGIITVVVVVRGQQLDISVHSIFRCCDRYFGALRCPRYFPLPGREKKEYKRRVGI